MSSGMASATLLPALGLGLPMAAVYGYSVSAPLRESTHAPRASVVDAGQQISITRLGQRVRIAGGAELAGAEHHTPTLQRLYRTLNDWFPGGAQLSSNLQIWRGARTMLPDGAPLVGASGVPGLWLNTGHGAGGWALACGCAIVATDRGGGSISLADATLSTAGSGSPLLYFTGDIQVNNVSGTSSGSQIAGMEGLNTILIKDSTLESTVTGKTASDPIATASSSTSPPPVRP